MNDNQDREAEIIKKWSKYQYGDGSWTKIVLNCIICDASRAKKNTEENLASCEDWEVNKKSQLQVELKELTEMVAEIGDIKCSIKQNGGVHNDRVSTQLGATFYGSDEICQSCGITVKKNDYGDIKEVEHKKSCSKGNKTPNREREREQIKQYFQSNNIKSITLKDNKLVMEYNNSQTETKLINTSELQAIQAYCQAHNLNALSFSDLQQAQTSKPFNWKSPWVIGGGIVLVVGMIGLVVYLVKRNKKEE